VAYADSTKKIDIYDEEEEEKRYLDELEVA